MMEFLNNIWIAMSTPNELLIKISSIPLAFIESPLSFYLIASVLNLSVNRKEKLMYIFSTAIVSLISLFFLVTPFNLIFNYISLFIIIHFTLKTNTLKTIVAAVLPSIVFTIVQSLIFNPYIASSR